MIDILLWVTFIKWFKKEKHFKFLGMDISEATVEEVSFQQWTRVKGNNSERCGQECLKNKLLENSFEINSEAIVAYSLKKESALGFFNFRATKQLLQSNDIKDLSWNLRASASRWFYYKVLPWNFKHYHLQVGNVSYWLTSKQSTSNMFHCAKVWLFYWLPHII